MRPRALSVIPWRSSSAVAALHRQALDRLTQPGPEDEGAPPVARAAGLMTCRCGRYFSEDFDGRLFCRGCEGTDPRDLTPRLPLWYRPA